METNYYSLDLKLLTQTLDWLSTSKVSERRCSGGRGDESHIP